MKKSMLKTLCVMLCIAVLSVGFFACVDNNNGNAGNDNGGENADNGGNNNGIGDYLDPPTGEGQENYGGVPTDWTP